LKTDGPLFPRFKSADVLPIGGSYRGLISPPSPILPLPPPPLPPTPARPNPHAASLTTHQRTDLPRAHGSHKTHVRKGPHLLLPTPRHYTPPSPLPPSFPFPAPRLRTTSPLLSPTPPIYATILLAPKPIIMEIRLLAYSFLPLSFLPPSWFFLLPGL